jgi:hypothetical protein
VSERFLKFIPSEEALYLLTQKGHAFRLLTIIAESARRYEGGTDGLKIGEALIGGHENYDMTESNYRSAKKILQRRSHIQITETCRNRKKVTTGVTTVGTRVKLLSSTVWDINSEQGNDRSNDRLTTDSRPTHEELRKKKKDKKDKKEPQTPSFPKIQFRENVQLTQNEFDSLFSKHGKDFLERMLDALDSYKGSTGKQYKSDFHTMKEGGWVIERVKKDILTSKTGLPSAIAENEQQAQKLEEKYSNFIKGWRCRIYTDQKKDQKGLLFESESPYVPTHFVAFANGRFKQEVSNFMKTKNLGEI